MIPLIAFTGYSRAGKDEAAKPLIAAGWERRAFGDIIKGQVDDLVKRHLGFTAFTETDADKQRIRALLELWGDTNYDGVLREFFATLPERCVNPRLCRVREGKEWQSKGGVLVQVIRETDGLIAGPMTLWEQETMSSLQQADLIDLVIFNDGTPADLAATVRSLFVQNAQPIERVGGRPRTVRCRSTLHP